MILHHPGLPSTVSVSDTEVLSCSLRNLVLKAPKVLSHLQAAGAPPEELANGHAEPAQSIHSLTTEEWRRRYETDGYVDLWVEEEFNAGSRVVVRHRR